MEVRERDGAGPGGEDLEGESREEALSRPRNFCVFICHLPLRTSTVGFAEDRLASLVLYLPCSVFLSFPKLDLHATGVCL